MMAKKKASRKKAAQKKATPGPTLGGTDVGALRIDFLMNDQTVSLVGDIKQGEGKFEQAELKTTGVVDLGTLDQYVKGLSSTSTAPQVATALVSGLNTELTTYGLPKLPTLPSDFVTAFAQIFKGIGSTLEKIDVRVDGDMGIYGEVGDKSKNNTMHVYVGLSLVPASEGSWTLGGLEVTRVSVGASLAQG